ncbi:MAG: fimbrillin family protein [Bacteroidales bacterium]|nr:fimbrillin family protein [Candidatus Hennigimonas equi]
MKTRYIIALAAGALVLAGCQRESLPEGDVNFGDGQIRYSISSVGVKSSANHVSSTGSLSLVSRDGKMAVPVTCEVSEGIDLGSGSAETKGALINTSGSDAYLPDNLGFTVSAYKGSKPQFTTQTATKHGDYWTMDPPQYWPLSTMLTFYAYTNAGGNTVSQTATSQTLTYTVTADAASHQDLMLGYYKGNGGNKGIAEMRFDHPLTAVRFKKGEMTGVTGIKSITLSGLASGGSVTMDADGVIGNWTVAGTENYETEVTLSNGDNLLVVDESSKFIGKDSEGKYNGAFLLIPQTLSEHDVTAIVVLATESGDVTVYADITSGTWQAGMTNTYTLGYYVEDPELLPGIFSVSPTEKVKFAKGNLFCKRDGSAGSYTYEFSMEKHQYDYRTRPKSMVASLISGPCVIDGIPGTTPDNMSGFFLWDIYDRAGYGAFETALTSGATSGSDVLDFGQVFGSDSNWTTLTRSEFEYLTDGGLSGSARPNAQNLIKKTTIHLPDVDVPGYVIAPDNFTGTLAAEYTLSDWETAETTSSLVFLPWIGSASGNSISSSGIFYWSQTASETNDYYAYCLKQNYDVPAVSGTSRAYGFPVRLVQKLSKPGSEDGPGLNNQPYIDGGTL